MPEIDWEGVRREFPALKNRTFLNTATYGQLPRRATEAALGHLTRRDERACEDFLSWFDDLDLLRAAIAELIHAKADDVAFITNAGQALAMAIGSIDWQPGDEILTLENEFPNQLYGAQCVKGVRGIQCAWNEFDQHISPRTRLVLLSTVDYVTGLRPNFSRALARLRERGILVYIDGTQSVGALDFDCCGMQPDFLSVDAYKWMISPNGAGFVCVHPSVREWLHPAVIGWRSDYDWRNVDGLHHGAPRFSGKAEQYEGGMLAFPSLYAMRSSLGLIEHLGVGNIEERVLRLAAIARQELHRLGAESEAPPGDYLPSQIAAVRFPGLDSSAIAKELAKQDVIVAARRGYLRVSPHFYNSEEDIARVVEALRGVLTRFSSPSRT